MKDSFFQSELRRYIQEQILGRNIFDFSFGNEKFWGVKRSKKIGPLSLSRYQILGFPASLLQQKDAFAVSFHRQQDIGFGDVFLQLGSDSILDSFPTTELANNSFCEDVLEKRKDKESDLGKLGLVRSFRENMPLSTVLTACDMDDAGLISHMHQMLRRNLKKAMKQGLRFVKAEEKHFLAYYELWTKVSTSKGVGIMGKKHFLDLCDYLYRENSGCLFVALDQDDRVCAGSLVVFWNDTIVYLYGAGSRAVPGAHVFVQHEAMKRGRDHHYTKFDHRGSYPTGEDDHHLYGVGKFKERFGGEKIEYVGNYDIVFSSLLYGLVRSRYQR